MDTKKAISYRLRMLRKMEGLTQEDIALILNINRSTYSYWESGKTKPSINKLIQISKLYNVTIDYIVGNKNSSVVKH